MKEIDSMWESLADLVQNHSKTLELPFAKVRPITRDCKVPINKNTLYHEKNSRSVYINVKKTTTRSANACMWK